QFRRLPDQRLPLDDYYSPDPTAPDKTYGYRAALIDGFDFDWASRRIPFSTFKATDIVHWLALEIADKALADAGYTRENVPHERTGVIVGNTLTGEQTRTNTIRLRWPYVRRAFRAACHLRGLSREQIMEVETAFETIFKSAFPSTNEDSLAGGLSNTIAGRICNFFDLRAGGHTIDGACSSSLLAVATGATSLADGDLDLALAGGVDISLDPFELVGFAKTNALTKKDMTVYDRRGSGFIPGEGCGFTVLKRLEDAERDNDYIYAVLHGWGISSDGGGTGITAPNAKGQARALENAYANAPYTIGTLKFIEGHGTGTTVGDQVELEGVSMVMDNSAGALKRTCGMTSLKSIIGHTKAASGIGGFIKTVMAVNRRVLPPIAGCRDPHPVFDTKARCLYPILQGEICNKSESLRAGVSAMGFGGINCHITLESGHAPSLLLKPAIEERSLLISNQDTEVFVLSADSVTELEK
ncbi:MAG: polyketide synthase, partial [Desulfobulbaceae bacterium]|nr:polyketide synthase [Desulfobulbaceae bacterium]